jgi:hypothetical protein
MIALNHRLGFIKIIGETKVYAKFYTIFRKLRRTIIQLISTTSRMTEIILKKLITRNLIKIGQPNTENMNRTKEIV